MGAKCKGCGSCILFIVTTVVVYKLSLPVFMENFDPEGDVPSDTRYLPKAERTYSGRHLLCHSFEGGLGSLLFQYASLLSLARSQNRIIVAKGDLSLEHVLRTVSFKTEKTQCQNVERISESFCCRVDEKIISLDRAKNYEVDGVLQSWKYFKDNMDIIRRAVTFHESVFFKAKRLIEHALNTNNHTVSNAATVGVHVRRGDKLHWTSVDMGYRVAPREYFIKAMRHYREHLNGPVVFLVVSDDHEWCQGNLLGLPFVILVGQHEPAVDLAILSLMDHSIISVGAYSWWAGFLAEGTVVYYKDFVSKDSKLRHHYDRSFGDYILPEWIAMS